MPNEPHKVEMPKMMCKKVMCKDTNKVQEIQKQIDKLKSKK